MIFAIKNGNDIRHTSFTILSGLRAELPVFFSLSSQKKGNFCGIKLGTSLENLNLNFRDVN
jgi:hypothetical protein